MYITISLRQKPSAYLTPDKPLKEIFKLDNHLYLMQGDTYYDENFPLLCQIEPDDPTYFDYDNMDQLIKELNAIRGTLSDPENLHHIDEIIMMAEECKQSHHKVMIFD